MTMKQSKVEKVDNDLVLPMNSITVYTHHTEHPSSRYSPVRHPCLLIL